MLSCQFHIISSNRSGLTNQECDCRIINVVLGMPLQRRGFGGSGFALYGRHCVGLKGWGVRGLDSGCFIVRVVVMFM